MLENWEKKTITCIHYDSESDLLIVAIFDHSSAEHSAVINFYKGKSSVLLNTIKYGKDQVYFLDYDPSTRLLLTSSFEKNVEFWNCETGQKMKTLHQVDRGLYKLQWDKERGLIAILETGVRGWRITEYHTKIVEPSIALGSTFKD